MRRVRAMELTDGWQVGPYWLPRTEWTREQVQRVEDMLNGFGTTLYDKGVSEGYEQAVEALQNNSPS
jgi:hypothetical protein